MPVVWLDMPVSGEPQSPSAVLGYFLQHEFFNILRTVPRSKSVFAPIPALSFYIGLLSFSNAAGFMCQMPFNQ